MPCVFHNFHCLFYDLIMNYCECDIKNKILNLLEDHYNEAKDKPVLNYVPKQKLQKQLRGLLTISGSGDEALYNIIKDIVLPYSNNLQSPMYMGHQVPPVLPLAAALDYVISILNQSLVVSRMSPVMTLVEQELISFLAKKIGYDDQSGGTVTSGGSISNLMGLICARNKYFPDNNLSDAVVLCPEESHYSVGKNSFVAGIKSENVVKISCDDNFKTNIAELERIIIELKSKKLKPFIMFANAGTTSTSTFDNLIRIQEITLKYDIWLHVDAAHGGSLILSEEMKHLINGINQADSLSVDGHKMMFMPSSMGMFFVKDENALKSCFDDIYAHYLYNDTEEIIKLSKYSLQCTKRADAFKLWGCLLAYGTDFFAEKYEYLHKMAKYFYSQVNNNPLFETANEPEFNIICFRYAPKNTNLTSEQLDEINFNLRDIVNNSGQAMITLTSLNDVIYLRVTLTNPLTDKEHLTNLLKYISHSLRGILLNI